MDGRWQLVLAILEAVSLQMRSSVGPGGKKRSAPGRAMHELCGRLGALARCHADGAWNGLLGMEVLLDSKRPRHLMA